MIADFMTEFTRYHILGTGAIAQADDAALNRIPVPGMNSIGMIVRHVSGNLKSRFTDFLTADGEKPWRDRDEEFAEAVWSREEITAMWESGFAVIDREVGALTEAHLTQSVTIRGVPLTVHAALCRSIAHVSHHTGQIITLARQSYVGEWPSLSIPKGGSTAYNANPTKEKRPS